jgi:hypothetical protein
MSRALRLGFLLFALAGCQLPAERLPLKPLPDDGQPLPYADLVTRARVQASAANEAYYVDGWVDLEDAAKGLEQTARFLAKASEVPAKHKDKLEVEAGDLGKLAAELRETAKGKEITKTNDVLQRINYKVRQLRPEN